MPKCYRSELEALKNANEKQCTYFKRKGVVYRLSVEVRGHYILGKDHPVHPRKDGQYQLWYMIEEVPFVGY